MLSTTPVDVKVKFAIISSWNKIIFWRYNKGVVVNVVSATSKNFIRSALIQTAIKKLSASNT